LLAIPLSFSKRWILSSRFTVVAIFFFSEILEVSLEMSTTSLANCYCTSFLTIAFRCFYTPFYFTDIAII
ncbi:MAG: hypothetical protein KDC74_06620, partial [Flavobacteriaceae bacterium]|nr:hypothetical protein [Flavobacteriaceae bacterium]